MVLRDLDIRRALHTRLADEHRGEPDILVVDELALCRGRARVDVAVVNGAFHGFEIKSEADRLDRLERQQQVYGEVLDTVTLVTCAKHLAAARRAVPPWWGLETARLIEGTVRLTPRRRARQNPNVDPFALASLLWREEALELLETHELASGLRSKPRQVLARALADGLSLVVLGDAIRRALKLRGAWRADQ